MRNSEGERFMERYAPTMKDLASRDVVSRAIHMEIEAGRGINGQGYVNLDAVHLGEEQLLKKLPDIVELSRVYLGVDPVKEPIPVQPTAHYAMGGIPTDLNGRVLIDDKKTPLYGLYAAGELVGGIFYFNYPGGTGLMSGTVFGRLAGASAGAMTVN